MDVTSNARLQRRRPSDEPTAPPGESWGISRRTLARGMAWTAPVVLTSVAVPAFAASQPCVVRQGTLVTNSSGSVTSITFGTGVTAITATVTYAAVRRGKEVAGGKPGNTGVRRNTDYTPSWTFINLHHPEGMKTDDVITMTIDFTTPVNNLSLTLTDIDRDTNQWIDHVFATPFSYSAVKTDPVFLLGTGGPDSPFVAYVPKEGEDKDIESPQGDVRLTWAAATTQVQIRYVAADVNNRADHGQHVGVGLFTLGC